MFEDEKEFGNLKKYQELLQNNNKIIEKTNFTIKEIEKIKAHHKDLELNKSREIQLTQEKIKQFVKEKNFVEIKKQLQKVELLKKDLIFSKQLANNTNKINLAANKHSILNKQIEDRLTTMGMREAQAKGFIEKKIAQVKNFVESKIVQYKINTQTKINEQMQNLKAKNNDLNASEKMQNLKKNELFEKLNATEKKAFLDKEKVQNLKKILNETGVRNKGKVNLPLNEAEMKKEYEIIKRENHTIYKKGDLKIKDYGNRITCNSNNPEDVKKIIALAEKKGWDLEKIKVNGMDKNFKKALNERIAERKKLFVKCEPINHDMELEPIDLENKRTKAADTLAKLEAAKQNIAKNNQRKNDSNTSVLNVQKQELPKQERSFTK